MTSAERLDQIAPHGDDTEADLVEYLESQLSSRQDELQQAVGRLEASRALLLEARRAAASLPPGTVLTIAGFLPHGLDDVTAGTRRYLIGQAMEEER